MKTKSIALFIFIGITSLLTSCGGNGNKSTFENKSTKLSVESKMSGALSENFEVINAVLKTEATSYSEYTKLLVEVKRTANKFSFDPEKADICGISSNDKTITYCITADVLNESGIPIATNLDIYGYDSFEKAIRLNTGETVWLEFSCGNATHEESKKVKLSSSLEKSTYSGNTSNISDDNTECDKFIKEYEAFADSYIKLIKKYKANPSDASILTDYTNAVEKAARMQNKAANCNDVKYSAKLMKIANKISKAVM